MNVLRSIRRGSALIFCCGWPASIVTAIAAVIAEDSGVRQRAMATEMVCLAAAVTATLIYVVASLTAHIDDTQWAIGYSAKFVPKPGTRGDEDAPK